MKYSDMHVHTKSSPDADLSAAELCRLASQSGVGQIGFVAHLDLHPDDFCYGGFQESGYLKDLNSSVDTCGVSVLKGLEIGEPHRFFTEASSMFSPSEYDFLTGALHWVGGKLILEESAFLGSDPLPLVEQYYRETLQIIDQGEIDIIAHIGIFRRGMARAGIASSIDETKLFPKLLKRILQAAIERGIAIEVNTAGLRRPERVTYPTPEVLVLFRELGGKKVTVGSDTHRADNAYFGLTKGLELLRNCGFEDYGHFVSGEYIASPLH